METLTRPPLKNMFGIAAQIHHQFPEGVPTESVDEDLRWQMMCGHNDAATKKIRTEVMLTQGLLVFGFMQPNDTTVSLLHSPATYQVRGGGPSMARISVFWVIGGSIQPQVRWYCSRIKPGNGLPRHFISTPTHSKLFSQVQQTSTSTKNHHQMYLSAQKNSLS